jgi:hypothetical protein
LFLFCAAGSICGMCCFSGIVEKVDATSIFARMLDREEQLLVYEMRLSAKHDVAMILPIPVKAGCGEDAVRFHSFEEYPELFEDLESPFRPLPKTRSAMLGTLKVQTVGAFVASFIPSLADFERVDPRFRIPPGTLELMPEYQDWGFAVFQLAATKGTSMVHPMAFQFPTRDPARLFFPTIHIHDGTYSERARFAHRFFAQGLPELRYWSRRKSTLERVLRRSVPPSLLNLFDLDRGLSKSEMFGDFRNRDIWALRQS